MRQMWTRGSTGLLSLVLASGCFDGSPTPKDSTADETDTDSDSGAATTDLPDDDDDDNGDGDDDGDDDGPTADLPDDDPIPDLPDDDDPIPDLPDDDDPICGDGIVDPGEACDDGNDVDGDGCNVDCLGSGTELFSIRVEPDPEAPTPRTRATAFGVTTDGDELVVVGYQEFQDPNTELKQRDGWVARYGAAGELAWEALYGSPNDTDELGAVEVSGPSLFVSGTLGGRAQLLQIGGADGALEQVLVDLPGQRIHDHTQVLGAGAVLVGEQAGHAETRSYDAVFGAPVWEDDLFGFGFTAHYGVALAEDLEAVYVSGELAGDNVGQMGWLLRYDLATGEQSWEQTFGSDGASGNAVAVLGDDVIVVGWRPVANLGTDIHVARYESDGSLVWQQSLDGGLGEDDGALGVAVDSHERIIVAGSRSAIVGNGQDPWVLKLDAEGDELWSRSLADGPGSGTLIDVAVYDDDRVALVGADGLAAIIHVLTP